VRAIRIALAAHHGRWTFHSCDRASSFPGVRPSLCGTGMQPISRRARSHKGRVTSSREVGRATISKSATGPTKADLLRALSNPDEHLHVSFDTPAGVVEAHIDAIEGGGNDGLTFALRRPSKPAWAGPR